MKKCILPPVLALMLALSLLPMAALAASGEPVAEPETEVVEEAAAPADGTAPESTAVEHVQALIDALPDADTITEENRADVEARLTAIDEAKLLLGDEEQDAPDFTKYNAAIAALNVLDDMAGAEIPETLAESTLQGNGTAADPWQLSSTDVFAEWDGSGTEPGTPYKKSGKYYLPAGSYTLTADITFDNILFIKGTVTLDLNGHTLTESHNGYFIGVGYYSSSTSFIGALTVKDSSAAHSGKIQGVHSWAVSVNRGSAFTLESGKIVGSGTDKKGFCVESGASATLKGGTVDGMVQTSTNATLYADGGTVTGAVTNRGTITRTDATITTATTFEGGVNNIYDGKGIIEWGCFKSTVENEAMTKITGGEFHGEVKNGCREYRGYYEWPTISGGEFYAVVNVKNGDNYMPSTYITGGTFYAGFKDGDADFNSKTHTVTFEKYDGTKTTCYVVTGNKVQGPTAPTREDGFSFSGWYEKENGVFKETAFDFDNTAITADTTLYARCVCVGEHTGGTATCRAKATCSACGEEYGDVDAANHTALNHVESKAATTEAEGNIEYWHCKSCDKYFSDKDGKTEIKAADTVIAKLTPEATATPAPTAKPQSPKTGDEANLALWLALATVSAMDIALVARKKKER